MLIKNVKVTRKGQITIPIEFREEMGIDEGDLVSVRRTEHGVEITRPDEWARRSAGIYRSYAEQFGPLTPDQIRELAIQYWTQDAMDGIETGTPDGKDS